MFTWDSISGNIEYFHFGVWSISCNSSNKINRNKTHWECNFILVLLTEKKFHFRQLNVVQTLSRKLNNTIANICTCEYKGNVLFKLVLWHSNCSKMWLAPRKQNEKQKNKNLYIFRCRFTNDTYGKKHLMKRVVIDKRNFPCPCNSVGNNLKSATFVVKPFQWINISYQMFDYLELL